MKFVLTMHLIELVDANVFFLKTWSKLEKFDAGQN
jgi:hypothetical protein